MKQYRWYKIVGYTFMDKPYAVFCKSPMAILERSNFANVYGSDDLTLNPYIIPASNWAFVCSKERFTPTMGVGAVKEMLGSDPVAFKNSHICSRGDELDT